MKLIFDLTRFRQSSNLELKLPDLDAPSGILGHKSIYQSQPGFSLLIGVVNHHNLGSSIFSLHSTTSSDLKLSLKLFQSSTEALFFFSCHFLLHQKLLSVKLTFRIKIQNFYVNLKYI